MSFRLLAYTNRMSATSPPPLETVTDVHSALNHATARVHRPTNISDLSKIVRRAAQSGARVAICGGRHAMGGQQFADKSELIDLRAMNRVLHLDVARGHVKAEGGIQWPELIAGIIAAQDQIEPRVRWGIAQKQTGADALTLGGCLSANIHGRGLLMAPIVSDVESFTLIGASGEPVTCSRAHNAELFSLVIGGYGLFGIIVDVTLRLSPRRMLRRIVRVIDIEDAVTAAERRIREGFLYGDFQFDIDPRSPDFLTKGVFSGYQPIDDGSVPIGDQRELHRDDWLNLLTLAHSDKSRAFTLYAQHYLATDGQLYQSDTHQLSDYIEGYHNEVDLRTRAACPGSEMITELYVPPDRLVEFLHAAAKLLIGREAQVIYGTIRLIQPDTETVMAWARERFACIVLNLHIEHKPAAINRAAEAFRALIDLADSLGGTYYLTYHRFATPQQLERSYPNARAFFAAKRRFDPSSIFESDWYRHYAPHFAAAAP